jgi:hypothetical protein
MRIARTIPYRLLQLPPVDVRLVLGCALLLAVVAGVFSLAHGQEYRARSFVIRVPPDFAGERGLARARRIDWLGERSSAELTSRQDLSFTVETSDRERSVALATAYAKAFRREIPPRPGLTTRVVAARDAERTLGPVGWTLLGGAAGLWLGMALAILRAGLRKRIRAQSVP